jgi:hypothetical protein
LSQALDAERIQILPGRILSYSDACDPKHFSRPSIWHRILLRCGEAHPRRAITITAFGELSRARHCSLDAAGWK